MFYRSYFPDDVDISVPYVAPLNRALEDVRPEIFINDKVSTKENRQKVIDFQTLLFERKAALMPLMEEYCKEMKYTFKEPLENVFDFCVLEYSFAFWQWGYNVDRIPTGEATDEQLFGYLMRISEPSYFTNQTGNVSFNVQAARELGYYGYYTKPFKKYLSIKTSKGYLKRLMLPTDAEEIKFSSELYKHTVSFLSKNDPKMIYIYGEQDPWTATGIYGLPLTKDKENLHVYLCKGGSHYTRIKSFPEETQQEIIRLINKWLQE